MMKIGVYLIVFGILMGTTVAELFLIGINISRTWLLFQ